MSESPVPAESSILATAFIAAGVHQYVLSSELARLSLPAEFKDSNRRLAWANSICFLFLLVGLVGIKAPRVIQRPLNEMTEIVPVIFTPPEEQPKPPPEAKPDEAEPEDKPLDTPQIAAVVAVQNSPSVAFSVPVEGAVATVRDARYATAPPPGNRVLATPVRFNPNATDGGSYPAPSYPGVALRNRYEGTVTIELMVDPSGTVTAAKIQKTSGFTVLDDAALSVVKNRWRFPPGSARYFFWPCTFQLQ